MQFSIVNNLSPSDIYILQFEIRTINGAYQKAEAKIVAAGDLPTCFKGTITAELTALSKETGSIKVSIICKNDYTDDYELLRYNSKNKNWEHIQYFKNMLPNIEKVWYDYSVEQGVKYKYGIRNCVLNEHSPLYKVFSEKVISNEV
jgi:hypothetical protein